MELTVEITHDGGVDTLRIGGEIDLATVGQLEDALGRLRARRLVIDLREVGFMDSSGLHALLRVREAQGDDGQTRLLIRRSGPVGLLLEMAGVADRFIVDEDGSSPA